MRANSPSLRSPSSLATLLTLADSRLPTGAHVHSGGVEEAITAGLVIDLTTLKAYLTRRISSQGLVGASLAAREAFLEMANDACLNTAEHDSLADQRLDLRGKPWRPTATGR